MRYILENAVLRIEMDSFGAELKSVRAKKTDREYMWYGDEKYWDRTSPILFPFIGNLKNKKYRYEGKEYSVGLHGFACDMEFSVISRAEDEIWFEAVSSEKTLVNYPFPFVLQIGYLLKDDQVRVMWKVENPAQKPMYFSIGAHPGFLCPVHGEDDKSGYRLYFDGLDELHHFGNDEVTGMSLHEDITLPLTEHRAVITKEFFDRCTYIVSGKQTGEIGLEEPDGRRIVTLYFDAPIFALWSRERANAPFVCIEPWFGKCDSIDFEGSLEEREYGNCLAGGETFETAYIMKFGV